jgi:hypothetical protein
MPGEDGAATNRRDNPEFPENSHGGTKDPGEPGLGPKQVNAFSENPAAEMFWPVKAALNVAGRDESGPLIASIIERVPSDTPCPGPDCGQSVSERSINDAVSDIVRFIGAPSSGGLNALLHWCVARRVGYSASSRQILYRAVKGHLIVVQKPGGAGACGRVDGVSGIPLQVAEEVVGCDELQLQRGRSRRLYGNMAYYLKALQNTPRGR